MDFLFSDSLSISFSIFSSIGWGLLVEVAKETMQVMCAHRICAQTPQKVQFLVSLGI